MRSLTIGHSVRSFLQTNYLPISKLAAVVHQRHRADRGADISRTSLGFVDFAAINLDLDSMVAGETAEECDFHIRDDGSGTDDETLYTDQLVRVYASWVRSRYE